MENLEMYARFDMFFFLLILRGSSSFRDDDGAGHFQYEAVLCKHWSLANYALRNQIIKSLMTTCPTFDSQKNSFHTIELVSIERVIFCIV